MTCGSAFIRRIVVGLCLVPTWLAGCAAFHPMTGVPARYVPDELKVGQRNGKRTIDLSLLRQDKPPAHLVDSGDVLGVYIGGVLGKIDENPQVQIPLNSDFAPAAGIPVNVREDGTISLPMVGPILVRGKTIRETEETIRQAYTNHAAGKEFLKPDRERIMVSLQRPRQTRVLVIRQDSKSEPMSNAGINLLNIGTAKRGTGKVVSLPAYSNDVLNALIATDGLPGLDAENAVYIIRRQANLSGPTPVWPSNYDPAEVIRQSQKVNDTVIRSQNPDGWNYQTQVPVNGMNPFTNPNVNFGQSSMSGLPPQGSEWDQTNDNPWKGSARAPINRPQSIGNPPGFGVGPAGVQHLQPWGDSNAMAPQTDDNPWKGSARAPINRPQSAGNPAAYGIESTGVQNLQSWEPSNGTAPPSDDNPWKGTVRAPINRPQPTGNPSAYGMEPISVQNFQPSGASNGTVPQTDDNNPWKGSVKVPTNRPRSAGNPSAVNVEPTSAQNGQPWGPSNGMPPQSNMGPSTQNFVSPAPPPFQGQQSQTPTPVPSMDQPFQPGLPSLYGPSFGSPPQPVVPGTNTNSALPWQGYSIPDASTQGAIQADPNGSYGEPIPYYPQDTTNSDRIGLADGHRIIRIPIRLGPNEHVDIKKEDIILHDGDIIFIESRDTEVFFTGGLLGGGQYTLPRDFDLDILQALSIATSRAGAGGAAGQIGGVSALNSDVTISPSNVVVIRKLPEGGEIPIKIDLYKARSDLSERIIIQPGDYIYLQYTPCEAIAAFVDRHLLEGALLGVFTSQLNRGN